MTETGSVAAESKGDALFKGATALFAFTVVLALSLVAGVLLQRAWPAIEAFGPGFLRGTEWDAAAGRFGAWPYIVGTLASSLLALAIAVPISIGSALALADLLPRRLATPLGFMVETLAAVPSIVFGVWGLYVIVPRVDALGGEATFGPSILAAGLVLAVMILPIITSISREMIHAVPRHQREAAFALGATRWEVTWRVVLPNARAGLLAASILGLGRAIGETMAVIMVIGNQPRVPTSVFEPGSTIPSLIANEFGDPSGDLHRAVLFELGLILLGISLVLNFGARLLVHIIQKRQGVRR